MGNETVNKDNINEDIIIENDNVTLETSKYSLLDFLQSLLSNVYKPNELNVEDYRSSLIRAEDIDFQIGEMEKRFQSEQDPETKRIMETQDLPVFYREKEKRDRVVEKNKQEVLKRVKKVSADKFIEQMNEYALNNHLEFFGDEPLSPEGIMKRYNENISNVKNIFNPNITNTFDFKKDEIFTEELVNNVKAFKPKEKKKIKESKLKENDVIRDIAAQFGRKETEVYLNDKAQRYLGITVLNANEETLKPLDKKLVYNTKNDNIVYSELNKDNLKKYLDSIKGLKQVFSKRSIIDKIFNKNHRESQTVIDNAIKNLSDKCLDKKLLNKYMKAGPEDSEKLFNELMEKSENRIKQFNKMNKDKIEENKLKSVKENELDSKFREENKLQTKEELATKVESTLNKIDEEVREDTGEDEMIDFHYFEATEFEDTRNVDNLLNGKNVVINDELFESKDEINDLLKGFEKEEKEKTNDMDLDFDPEKDIISNF